MQSYICACLEQLDSIKIKGVAHGDAKLRVPNIWFLTNSCCSALSTSDLFFSNLMKIDSQWQEMCAAVPNIGLSVYLARSQLLLRSACRHSVF